MTKIQTNWIKLNSHFCAAHRKLEKTGEQTMEDGGCHQSNLVNKIVAHMSGLPFTYLPQEPAYTPLPNSGPVIVPTIQPTPVSNVATDAVSNILSQLLTRMQHMQ